MFTGIIEEVGSVVAVKTEGRKRRLTISCAKVLPELKVGDSVSVSGVCLTAVEITAETFSADLAQETWLRTSFSRLQTGALVNLELPMRASGRWGSASGSPTSARWRCCSVSMSAPRGCC